MTEKVSQRNMRAIVAAHQATLDALGPVLADYDRRIGLVDESLRATDRIQRVHDGEIASAHAWRTLTFVQRFRWLFTGRLDG